MDNLFAELPITAEAEQIVALLTRADLKIERIVSTGQASPPGFWYDQPHGEWVLVLRGAKRSSLSRMSRRRARSSPGTASISLRIGVIAWRGHTRASLRCGSPCTTARVRADSS